MNYKGQGEFEFGCGNVRVDPAVEKELPAGCKVVAIEEHGVSFWAKTGRIDVELNDSSNKSFFIKVVSDDVGRQMARGEYKSMTAIYAVTPDFIPRPIAWGSYEAIEGTHFFMCEYRDMSTDMPKALEFTSSLARLHKDSTPPSRKFGFSVQTFAGNLPQQVEWEDSWEVFFSKSLRHALDLEIERKGNSPEIDLLAPVIFDRVIPRLLRPLESDGRSVQPSLVHGDLWHANCGTDVNNGQMLVFDACCFYAHNEYEFGQWRPACNKFGQEYIDAYIQQYPISEPKEDFYGRLDLYRLRFDTHVSALFADNTQLRQQVVDVMRNLVGRYGGEKPALANNSCRQGGSCS